ncbi:MAG: NADPH:quinone oxidoreductase family protein [Actinomycetota bacterium]|nr:NADPH:quinone oxidoreductase family protein [Actinomycetota bacterium]
MRAVVCEEYGPPEALVVCDVPLRAAKAGQLQVQVAAAAVNFPDVLICANQYQVSMPLPFTPGSEFAGVVTEVGEGVQGFAVGERVFGSTMAGGFAEYVTAPAEAVRKVPDGVSLNAAAGFWVAHATAYHALRSVAEVQPGDKVVVLGAAGGVGLAAVELAVALGAVVIAGASSAEKLALCRERGAAHTIEYTTTDLRDGIREVAPDGADVIIDPVGGPLAERALRATKWGGRFVTVGFASGEIPRIPLNLVLLKGPIIKGFEIRTFAHYAPEAAARDERELLELLAAGKIAPHISAEYPLEQAGAALRFVADRKATGKVLITA